MRAAPLTPRLAGRRAIVRTPSRPRSTASAASVATVVEGSPSVLAEALTALSAGEPLSRCRQRR
jgi:hypothetical protein